MKKLTPLIIGIFLSTSCAMLFNKKTVDVPVSSSPPGANIYINGKNYGTTPRIITLEPKETKYRMDLIKEGYGATSLEMNTWVSLRRTTGDTLRCLADSLGTMLVIPAASFFSIYCRDFKEKEYFAQLPNLTGASPENMQGFNPYGNASPFNPMNPQGGFNPSAMPSAPNYQMNNNPANNTNNPQNRGQATQYNPYDTPYNQQQEYYQPQIPQPKQPSFTRID